MTQLDLQGRRRRGAPAGSDRTLVVLTTSGGDNPLKRLAELAIHPLESSKNLSLLTGLLRMKLAVSVLSIMIIIRGVSHSDVFPFYRVAEPQSGRILREHRGFGLCLGLKSV